MPDAGSAAAVLYAKDIAPVARFYAEVAGLLPVHREGEYIVLESHAFQLVVLAVSPSLAAAIQLSRPPRPREDTAVKLVLFVDSLDRARRAALMHGGQLHPPAREWLFRGDRVCDGVDPEGNEVQFRAPAAAAP
ncbi:VOC family protein [Dyella sp.]|jgi:predicted enzyme related to lactoylglutathione lyase|uniref:VOC family protein n=1 Tax=Dyella sp. TaxID=1869338 RepID=UPI002D782ACA|nr:VOC family protein [Dyella sp.]HET6433184.1 VOC family protein [Dyella sp.]